MSSEELN